jgi:hypothetical protein
VQHRKVWSAHNPGISNWMIRGYQTATANCFTNNSNVTAYIDVSKRFMTEARQMTGTSKMITFMKSSTGTSPRRCYGQRRNTPSEISMTHHGPLLSAKRHTRYGTGTRGSHGMASTMQTISYLHTILIIQMWTPHTLTKHSDSKPAPLSCTMKKRTSKTPWPMQYRAATYKK